MDSTGMEDVAVGGTAMGTDATETAARHCLRWGIVLIVLGGIALYGLPYLTPLLSESAGPSAAIGYGAVDAVTGLVRWTLMPMGTTLIGAAIVIRVLAPTRASRSV